MSSQGSTPPRVPPRIKAAPKIRQVYWCDFWQDAQLPEMWKTRPVVILSYRHTLTGHCLVVPTSTDPQLGNPWAHKLSFQIHGGRDSWVICNHPYTVATSRLSALPSPIPRVAEAEFHEILRLVLAWLPKLPPIAEGSGQP